MCSSNLKNHGLLDVNRTVRLLWCGSQLHSCVWTGRLFISTLFVLFLSLPLLSWCLHILWPPVLPHLSLIQHCCLLQMVKQELCCLKAASPNLFQHLLPLIDFPQILCPLTSSPTIVRVKQIWWYASFYFLHLGSIHQLLCFSGSHKLVPDLLVELSNASFL